MALHPDFPQSPHALLEPELRWVPEASLRKTSSEMPVPPLVAELRRKVKEFRESGYAGAADTSRSLLKWWFAEPHLLDRADGAAAEFRYFFAQREAVETIAYLYDAVGARDKFDLMRFDSSGVVSTGLFPETWRRFVLKMATGTGKTKVLSLVLAWSYFHKLYEAGSQLARNFLVIAPNIIVLDRIRKDFEGLRIFFADPVIPDNGFDGCNWRDDFQLALHLQDDVRVTRSVGNIFLTNIHRVYAGDDAPPSPDDDDSMDYFLGKRPTGAATDSKVDLGAVVRDIDELAVLNDEAHHIHDDKLAWFKSIQDIHNRLKQKGAALSLQVDVTATPKHNNGAVFVQTVADYPLVEAIAQNVVKHPVLPDAPSRAKLAERQSAKYTEKYADHIDLGVVEWRKAFAEHEKLGKKAILFVMTDDTRNCDEVAAYLENRYPDLENAVLVIHTKNNGEISEAGSGKAKYELEKLRKLANEIDAPDNPYKAIVSVLVLKEGWDVRNVTTIVGLRAYSAKSNVLPEQTLGRGLRKMYSGDTEEYVSVVGTDAFMDFVESIKAEGVELERAAMGVGAQSRTPLVVEIDRENDKKDIAALDIELPVLAPRIYREYGNLADLDAVAWRRRRTEYRHYGKEGPREIVFRDIVTGEEAYTTTLDPAGAVDYRSVIGYFTRTLMRKLRLVSGYDVLFGKIKAFVRTELFDRAVDLDHPDTVRNLADTPVHKELIEAFERALNALIVRDGGGAEIRETLKISGARPFMVKDQPYLLPMKSVFNRIVGDGSFELQFAQFLEDCEDVVSYAKNYLAVGFKLDYVKADGGISNYYPDFLVKTSGRDIFVVETKGREDLDVPLKMARLRQWCEDVNRVQSDAGCGFVYIDQERFEKYRPKSFEACVRSFREYQPEKQSG